MPLSVRRGIVNYLPSLAFFSVYAVTCLIAVALFMFNYEPFVFLVKYFSGTVIPLDYTFRNIIDYFLLFVVAPAIFFIGYVVSLRVAYPVSGLTVNPKSNIKESSDDKLAPLALFILLAVWGIYDLYASGAFSYFRAWVDYGQWVKARWELFSTLGYFSFVNLYFFVPMAAAWIMLSQREDTVSARSLRWGAVLIALVFTFFLFQKKALITAVIVFFCTFVIDRYLRNSDVRQLKRILGSGIAILSVLYFGLVVLPVYSETSQTAEQVLVDAVNDDEGSVEGDPVLEEVPQLDRRSMPGENDHTDSEAHGEIEIKNVSAAESIISLLGPNRSIHVLTYALMAPLTRTSAPAMFYPIIFPEHHDYYGLDWGQDILGWGNMPDDNRYVWSYMYPNTAGGSVGAPFQFVLYSQVGTAWTILLSGLVGMVVGGLWRLVLESQGDPIWRSLLGAMVLLFCIFIAIDSVRGSITSSYGVLWGCVFILLMQILRKFVSFVRTEQSKKPAVIK